jgi:hypothetical protein
VAEPPTVWEPPINGAVKKPEKPAVRVDRVPGPEAEVLCNDPTHNYVILTVNHKVRQELFLPYLVGPQKKLANPFPEFAITS